LNHRRHGTPSSRSVGARPCPRYAGTTLASSSRSAAASSTTVPGVVDVSDEFTAASIVSSMPLVATIPRANTRLATVAVAQRIAKLSVAQQSRDDLSRRFRSHEDADALTVDRRRSLGTGGCRTNARSVGAGEDDSAMAQNFISCGRER